MEKLVTMIGADPNLYFLPVLFLMGMLASFVNMLAGGGSILVLGLMTMMGVEPSVANATNRVGVLISTASGAAAYKSGKYTELKESLKLSLWTMPGAIAGAFYSVNINSKTFEHMIAAVMLFILVTLFLPKRTENENPAPFLKLFFYPSLIIVGFYGGFIQAGVGFLIMGSLRHLGNMELMRMNMHRVFIVLLFTIPAIVVFLYSGKINWLYALVLSAGSGLGSWITIKLALKKGAKVVKYGLAAAIVLMAGKLLLT
jgi:uncharacterized protein